MKIGITYRLFLASLAATVLAVAVMLLIMQWSIGRGFLRYVNSLEQARLVRLVERLEESYARQGSWNFLRLDQESWRRLVTESQTEGGPAGPFRPGPRWPRHAAEEAGVHTAGAPPPNRQFAARIILLDAERKKMMGSADIPPDSEMKPLYHNQRVVGYLGLMQCRQLSEIHHLRFVEQQKLALGMVAGVVLLVAAALSFPLASRLVRPIKALAAATHRLAAGDFGARVKVGSSDELGRLAGDFNTLALTLEKNEQARRQWVADISHELRTPLAVMRGEVEALQDGIRQCTPDSLRSIHGEVLRLNRLVDDLYHLSLSDLGGLTYRKEELDLGKLVTDAVALYRSRFVQKGITLVAEVPETKAMVFGDPERLQQLFANLFDNSLKYTDTGGRLVVSLEGRDNTARVEFQDSSPDVPESEMGKLFDRLYRVETSRNRAFGGAGLGLAICRNIAEAHGGTITAQPSPMGGLWIEVELPL